MTHHKIAQLLAGGMKYIDAAKIMGISPQRIQQLLADPTFQNLVAEYRDLDMGEVQDYLTIYRNTVAANALRGELHVTARLDRVEEEGETLPIRDALAISRDAADRLGLGKVSARVNVNDDFAAKLERAVARSKTILGTATTINDVSAPRQSALPSPDPSLPEDFTSPSGATLELSASPAPSRVGEAREEPEVTPPSLSLKRRF